MKKTPVTYLLAMILCKVITKQLVITITRQECKVFVHFSFGGLNGLLHLLQCLLGLLTVLYQRQILLF